MGWNSNYITVVAKYSARSIRCVEGNNPVLPAGVYAVTFDPGADIAGVPASGTPFTLYTNSSGSLTVPGCPFTGTTSTPTFAGWSYDVLGNGTMIQIIGAGGVISGLTGNITLYATWKP